MLIVDLNHLNRNIVTKSVLSLICYLKQITQSPIIYSLAFFRKLSRSTLDMLTTKISHIYVVFQNKHHCTCYIIYSEINLIVSYHSKSLSRSCLTICKYANIVTIKNRPNQRLHIREDLRCNTSGISVRIMLRSKNLKIF